MNTEGGAYVRPWALGSATKVHKKIIRKNHSFQQSNQRLEQSTLHAVDATSVNMLKTRLNKTWKDMGSYSWKATQLIFSKYEYKYK